MRATANDKNNADKGFLVRRKLVFTIKKTNKMYNKRLGMLAASAVWNNVSDKQNGITTKYGSGSQVSSLNIWGYEDECSNNEACTSLEFPSP